jgi:hypothetical protein
MGTKPSPRRSDTDPPVTPEVEAELRKRFETFDDDAKVARPWEDVLAAPNPPPLSPSAGWKEITLAAPARMIRRPASLLWCLRST